MSIDELKKSGINKVSDFKDGTIFVLLGCELLGSEKLNTCKDYVYVKIGDKLLNHLSWFPVNVYKDIDHKFKLKKQDTKFELSLEYEIYQIHQINDLDCLDFDDIYKKISSNFPIWENTLFPVSNISIEQYFLNNFDIDVYVEDN